MNIINIPYLENLNGKDACSATRILDEVNSTYKIDTVNWPVDFPYCPESSFHVARSHNALYLKFSVTEMNIRALYMNDQEPVWEDSCVEFFCKIKNSDTYMNFEFNCIGTCVATTRKGRNEDVIPFTENQMKEIDRFSTLYRQILFEKKGLSYWELTVKIPFHLMGIDPFDLPKELFGNFYKCADGASSPHYVSWNPISTGTPNFHCPEYFGKLVFEK
jgi:hypothetical protein